MSDAYENDPYGPLVDQAARAHNVPPEMIRAIMHRESANNPNAVSSAGAGGLMQLMPATARGLGVTDRFDPAQNIDAGTRYYRQMLDRYNDPALALSAYNAGPGRVDQHLATGAPLPAETRAYAPAVLARAGQRAVDPLASLPEGFELAPDPMAALPEGFTLVNDVGPATASKAPAQEAMGEFRKGLEGGFFGSNPKMFGSAVDALGVLTGSDTLRNLGQKVSGYGEEQLKQYAPSVGSVANVSGLSSAADYAKYALGQGLSSIAPGAVTGVIASAVTANPIVGAAVGSLGPSYLQNLGDVYSSMKEDAGVRARLERGDLNEKDLAQAGAIAAIPMAALDAAGVVKLVGNIAAPAKEALKGALVKRILKGGLEGAGVEGLTEGLQETISQWTQAHLGDTDALTKERVVSVLDNAIGGALVGGTVGGAGKAVQRGPKEEAAPVEEEAQPEPEPLALPAPRPSGEGFTMGDNADVRAAQADVKRWSDAMDEVQAALNPVKTEGMTDADYAASIPTEEERADLVKRWTEARDNYQAARNRVDNLMPPSAAPEGVQPPEPSAPLPPRNLPAVYQAPVVDEALAALPEGATLIDDAGRPMALPASRTPLLERPRGVQFGEGFEMRSPGEPEPQRALPSPPRRPALAAPTSQEGEGFVMGAQRPVDVARANEIQRLDALVTKRTREMGKLQQQVAQEIDPVERSRLTKLFKAKNAEVETARGRLAELRPVPEGVQPPATNPLIQAEPQTEASQKPTREPAQKPEAGESLFQFLARKGGIQDYRGELRSMDLDKAFVPSRGKLVRKTGLPLDKARELAEEAGYIKASDADRFGRTGIDDLLEALRNESFGRKVYPEGIAPEKTAQPTQDRGIAEADVASAAKALNATLTEGEANQAVAAMLERGISADDAVEQTLTQAGRESENAPRWDPNLLAEPIPFRQRRERKVVPPETPSKIPVTEADLRKRLKDYGIDDRVGFRLVDAIRSIETGEILRGTGTYLRTKKLIEIVTRAQNPNIEMDHEVIHALRDLGLFTESEWATLTREALRNKELMASTRRDYADNNLPERFLREEAIAEMFAQWRAGNLDVSPETRTLFQRIVDFFHALAEALRGQGFKSAEDVFNAVVSGEVGNRGRAASAASPAPEQLLRKRGTPLTPQEQALHESIIASDPSIVERFKKALSANPSGLGSEFVRQFVNQFEPIFAKEMKAEALAGRKPQLREARKSAAKMVELAMDDRTGTLIDSGPLKLNPDGSLSYVKGVGGLADIFKPLSNAEDYKRFNIYAVARRAQRLKAEGRENLLSDAQIKAGMALETPEFKKIFDDYQRFNKAMLDFAVDTGVMKADARDLYAQSMDYVPFYRVMEDTGEIPGANVMRKLSNPDPKIRKLEGGTEKIGDIAENIIRNATSLARAGMRNEAMRRVHGIMEEIGEAKNLTSADDKAGSAAFYDKGVKRHFIADDPAFMAALAGLKPEAQNGFYKALAGFSNLLRRGVTASPGFMLANTIRDTAAAGVQTGKNMSLANNAVTGLVNAARNDAVMQELKAATGLGSYEFGHTPGDAAGKLKRRLGVEVARTPGQIIEKVLHPLEAVGGWTELANRDALYRNLIKQGVDPFEAAYQAKNLLNFSRKGANASLRFLLPLVPFLNARIQGLYRLAETQGNKKALMGVAARGLLLTGISAALYALYGDDERAKDEPIERRLNYYILYPDKDTRVLIPKPFEFGAIFSTMPEFLFDAIAHEKGDDLAKATASTFLNTFSFNPIPQAVRPTLEAYTNYDFFTGRPIEGPQQQRVAPGERADARTSSALKALGREMNVSPMQMEHLIGGYLGTLGQMSVAGLDAILAASGMAPSKPSGAFGSIPIVSPVVESALGRFLKLGPDAANRWVGDFYELRRNADEVYNTVRRLREEGELDRARSLQKSNAGLLAARKQLTKMADQIGGLNARINDIRSDDELSPDEKRVRMDRLIAQRNAVARRTSAIFDRIKARKSFNSET